MLSRGRLQSAADRHQLAALSAFTQDAILGVVALVHVFVLTRATTAGMAGPLVRPVARVWNFRVMCKVVSYQGLE